MDPMSSCDIHPVLTFPPKDSTLQYKKCVNLWNNFPCNSTLGLVIFLCDILGTATGLPSKDDIVKTTWNSLNMTFQSRIKSTALNIVLYNLLIDMANKETDVKLQGFMNIRKDSISFVQSSLKSHLWLVNLYLRNYFFYCEQ